MLIERATILEYFLKNDVSVLNVAATDWMITGYGNEWDG